MPHGSVPAPFSHGSGPAPQRETPEPPDRCTGLAESRRKHSQNSHATGGWSRPDGADFQKDRQPPVH
ncbi:hypothetical protein [Azospirillum palustre]